LLFGTSTLWRIPVKKTTKKILATAAVVGGSVAASAWGNLSLIAVGIWHA